MTAPDPFALGGRQDADAELHRLIAEYRRLEEALGVAIHHEDDDEANRLHDTQRPVRDNIEVFRPSTLAGVLASLELAGEIDDYDYWPEETIKGLRVLVEGGAR